MKFLWFRFVGLVIAFIVAISSVVYVLDQIIPPAELTIPYVLYVLSAIAAIFLSFKESSTTEPQ